MKLEKLLRKSYVNLRGWNTKAKLVVIESDDWGSIRMKSHKTVQKLYSENIPVEYSQFTQFDGLERVEDIEALYEVLSSVKDSRGNFACITPLVLTANPSFDRIRSNGFEKYEYESITETFSNYNEDGVIDLWNNFGIKENLFYPQFHGREHLNHTRWMKAIKQQDSLARKAFEQESILGILLERSSQKDNHMAAFEAINFEEQDAVDRSCKIGLEEFERLFGYKSISAMPSQSIISDKSIKTLISSEVKFLQCGQHFVPTFDSLDKRDYLWGHQDTNGMLYWRRNVNFEPYQNINKDHIDESLAEIALAFRFGKPAVISSHRINFTSRVTTSIRDVSLKQLKSLLKVIVRKWPDVQFISSAKLAEMILKTK